MTKARDLLFRNRLRIATVFTTVVFSDYLYRRRLLVVGGPGTVPLQNRPWSTWLIRNTLRVYYPPIQRQDPEQLEGRERVDYLHSRRRWKDLIEDAPEGSIGNALSVIAGTLYEEVGEVGGYGIGRTFEENKELFWSGVSVSNVSSWAKYETAKIQDSEYTPLMTKVAGQSISEAGRAWIIWHCHCAKAGKSGDQQYVAQMNSAYPSSGLTSADQAAIRTVTKLIA